MPLYECLTSRVMNGADSNLRGWFLDGVLVHPLEAYTSQRDWLLSFEHSFPDRKQKMKEYSAKQEWSEQTHIRAWVQVLVPWLNKVGELK